MDRPGEVRVRIGGSGACHSDLHVKGGELEEVLALARSGAITAQVEQYPLEKINDVFDRLANGEVRGRAVLDP